MPNLRLCFVCFLLLTIPCLRAGEPLALVNPGFEEGDIGWRFKETASMSSVSADAAYDGSSGLRVDDLSPEEGSNAISGMVPVVPGGRYLLSFWARSSSPPPVAGVFLWFYTADKKLIPPKDSPASMVGAGDGKWHRKTLEFTVPDGAAHVGLWVHSLSKATGTVDFDAFEIREATDEGPLKEELDRNLPR